MTPSLLVRRNSTSRRDRSRLGRERERKRERGNEERGKRK